MIEPWRAGCVVEGCTSGHSLYGGVGGVEFVAFDEGCFEGNAQSLRDGGLAATAWVDEDDDLFPGS